MECRFMGAEGRDDAGSGSGFAIGGGPGVGQAPGGAVAGPPALPLTPRAAAQPSRLALGSTTSAEADVVEGSGGDI